MKSLPYRKLTKVYLVLTTVVAVAGCSWIPSNRTRVGWPAGSMGSSTDGWWEGGGTGGRGIAGSGEWANRFWLDFEGATVTSAQSFIVRRAGLTEAVIPAFQPDDLGTGLAGEVRSTLIDAVVDEVKERFEGLDIEFFLSEPDPPYHRVHIGGSDFTGQAGVVGVAPLDIGNFRGNDILYVFSEELSNSSGTSGRSLLASVIVHEIGHSAGNQHINNTEAVLNPFLSPTAVNLNRSGPRSSGEGTENSFQILRGTLGDATAASTLAAPPSLSALGIVSDGDMATLTVLVPENVEANPNVNLRDVSYEWEFQGETAIGHTVRADFEGLTGSIPVTITATTPAGQTAIYEFEVDRGE